MTHGRWEHAQDAYDGVSEMHSRHNMKISFENYLLHFAVECDVIDCWLGLLHQTDLFLDANDSFENCEHCVCVCDAFGDLMSFENSCESDRREEALAINRITENAKRTSREIVNIAIFVHEQDNKVNDRNSQSFEIFPFYSSFGREKSGRSDEENVWRECL